MANIRGAVEIPSGQSLFTLTDALTDDDTYENNEQKYQHVVKSAQATINHFKELSAAAF